MARDIELDRRHDDQEKAFHEKQEAYRNWKDRLPEQGRLYQKKKETERALDEARAEMNREYEELHRYDYIWDEYNRIKEMNNPRIEALKARADYLAGQMKDAFQRASDAYNYGSKSLAPGYSAEGKQYKSELKIVNAEVKELCSEVKSAKRRAEQYQTNPAVFRAAQTRFRAAESAHNTAKSRLNDYVAETNRLKEKFEEAKKKHLQAEEKFKERLAVVKAAKNRKQSENERLMDKAGIPFYYRERCKVRREADGTVNFYFGGIGENDGLGHGHVSMDGSGKVTYNRDVFDKHGKENYTDFQERQKVYKETHSSAWLVQDDNENYTVKVKGDYLYGNPHLGKDPDIERTDFLFFPKDRTDGAHAHLSIGEDTGQEVKVWHNVRNKSQRRKSPKK